MPSKVYGGASDLALAMAKLPRVSAMSGGVPPDPLSLFGSQLAAWIDPRVNTLSLTPVALTGTWAQTGNTLTGIGTAATSELRVGDTVAGTGISGIVTAIASATSVTLDSSATVGAGVTLTATPIAGVSDRVTTMLGLDPLARGFTQATFAKKPSLCALSEVAGATRRKFKFDGIADIMVNATAFLTGSAGAVFASWEMPSGAIPDAAQVLLSSCDEGAAADSFVLIDAYNSNALPQLLTVQRSNGGTVDGVRGSTTVLAATRYMSVHYSNGTAFFQRLNGTQETLTVTTGADSGDWFGDTTLLDNVTIGGRKQNTETQFLRAYLDTLFVLDGRAPTAAEIVASEAYMASVW